MRETLRSRSSIPVENSTAEPDPSPRWYAVRTRSRHEKKVRDQLVERQVETFLPVWVRWSRWKDRMKKIESPLFPGYCFARFVASERLRVLNAHGVAGLVCTGNRPDPLPDGDVEAIRRLVASRFRYDPHPLVEEGMEVEVVRGPLAGVRGRLLRKDRSSRLVIGVHLIHQAASVEVHPADVVRV